MTQRKERKLKDIGELALIDRLCSFLPRGKNEVLRAGDDCAVVRQTSASREDLLLTSDAVIEGTHFEATARGTDIGNKAMARAVSDIASMGGKPLWALVNLVAPPRTTVKKIDDIYMGLRRVANIWNFGIIGGDTSSGPVLELHVFLVGKTPRGRALRRSGARSGNIIFVTGTLGGSRRRKHLRFDPRLREGLFLRDWATSMIDISDGLVTDLYHLTDRSFTGAHLDLRKIPISKDAHLLNDNVSALKHALYDGEDFELLFTVPALDASAFMAAWERQHFDVPCTAIGKMTRRIRLIEYTCANGKRKKLEPNGYQHFKK